MPHHDHHDDLRGHPHRHEGERPHEHPHHHRRRAAAEPHQHAHGHPLSFERLTYICSPVHSLDPRAKIVSALLLIVGVVAGPQLRVAEFAAVTALLLAVGLTARIPLLPVVARSALVIPLAGGIAAFAPLNAIDGAWTTGAVAHAYGAQWPLIASIVGKAWLSATTALLVAATTPAPRLFLGLSALRMPAIFLTMLSFLHRYTEVLGDQLRSMRKAVASRAPNLSRRQLVRFYGNLAGNLFVRSYERGERVHAAMLSRGYDGTIPTAHPLRFAAADALTVLTALTALAALLLY